MIRTLLIIKIMVLLALVACQDQSPSISPTNTVPIATATSDLSGPAEETRAVPTSTPIAQRQDDIDQAPSSPREPAAKNIYAYTNQRPDGNRVVGGQGALPLTSFIDIPLKGVPQWIVAAPLSDVESEQGGSLWVVVLADGRTSAFIVENGQAIETQITPSNLENMPPLLKLSDDRPEIVVPSSAGNVFAPPAILDEEGTMAIISADGELQIIDPAGIAKTVADVRPLPDARLLTDGSGRLLLLAEPTTRYDHGVLGDGIEAAAIIMVDTKPEPEVVLNLPISEPAVVEGIAPLWADLNGDGEREIIVTQSDIEQGAQIVVYDQTGNQLATGPAIGRSYRWRHQIAVAPFGPGGEIELVDVLTPHIGGVVEFYRLEGDQLRIVAQVPGFTSHRIGTPNLDMALAGDVDGDGTVEVLLPTQARTDLGAIQRTADGAEVAWMIPVGGQVITNLAAVPLANGGMAIGAGREDGVLRVWHP